MHVSIFSREVEPLTEQTHDLGPQGIVTFNLRDFGAAATQFGVGLYLPREALALLKG